MERRKKPGNTSGIVFDIMDEVIREEGTLGNRYFDRYATYHHDDDDDFDGIDMEMPFND